MDSCHADSGRSLNVGASRLKTAISNKDRGISARGEEPVVWLPDKARCDIDTPGITSPMTLVPAESV